MFVKIREKYTDLRTVAKEDIKELENDYQEL